MGDFSGDINYEEEKQYPKLPVTKDIIPEHITPTNPTNSTNPKDSDNFWIVLTILSIFVIIFVATGFLYFVSQDKFKTTIDQEINPVTNVDIENEYNFTIETENDFYNNNTYIFNFNFADINFTDLFGNHT